MQRAVTHNGVFHADDVLAGAILRFLVPEIRIERTRDREVLEAAKGDPAVVVFDVGGEYNPSQNNFDHHQRGWGEDPSHLREGVPLSSAGLLWRAFGPAILAEAGLSASADLAAAAIWEDAIRGVDILDNGVEELAPEGRGFTPAVMAIAKARLPRWDEEGVSLDERYEAAVEDVLDLCLRPAIARAAAAAAAREVVMTAHFDEGGSALVLPRFCPWQEHLFVREEDRGERILFVIFPEAGNTGSWMIQQVPTRPGSFVGRKPLPAAWAGLRAEDLDAATGVGGGVFCHPGRFIAGHSTQEGALALAHLAKRAEG